MDRKTVSDLGAQPDPARVKSEDENLIHAVCKSLIYLRVTPLNFHDVSVAEETAYTVELLLLRVLS